MIEDFFNSVGVIQVTFGRTYAYCLCRFYVYTGLFGTITARVTRAKTGATRRLRCNITCESLVERATFGAFQGRLLNTILRVSIYQTFIRYTRETRTTVGLGLATLVGFHVSK